MKINEQMYALVDNDGNVLHDPETDAIGTIEQVKFILNSDKDYQKMYQNGTAKIIKVKIVQLSPNESYDIRGNVKR